MAVSKIGNPSYNYGTAVNLLGYNSSSNLWTAPQDGFVFAQVWNNDSTIDCWFDTGMFQVRLQNSTAGFTRSYATFVKKGMKMWFGGSGSNRSCNYNPLFH